MASQMTDAVLNVAADAIAATITHLSLHTDDPGVTGANEATGGSPAYARLAVSFTAAGAEGVLGAGLQPATAGIAWSDEVTFDVDAGTYSHWGSWDDVSAGNFRVCNDILPAPQVEASQAQIVHSIGVGPVAGA